MYLYEYSIVKVVDDPKAQAVHYDGCMSAESLLDLPMSLKMMERWREVETKR
jgi:hypothetical protein